MSFVYVVKLYKRRTNFIKQREIIVAAISL